MPLETLDRTPPPFFKQGPSALSQLVLLSALALFLMVADARFHLVQPLRAAIATVLYPAQWLALQPVQAAREFGGYLTDLKTARKTEEAARRKLAEQSQRAGQVEQLLLENARLRGLLALRERIQVPSQAAQVLYDATDPYSRRVVIDKGQLQDIAPGSPVLDGEGVPRSFTISSNEILEALTEPLNSIVSEVKKALEETPPELGADIAERGMMLTGGGALLRDLERLLAEETGLPVLVAEEPLTCVVRGCGLALERMERLGNIFTNE